MEKIFILDAVNYLFRSYYAISPMTNSKGESTSALYGFIRSVQKVIKDFSPEHFVCVFDGPDNKKSRTAVYAEYKMHRKGAPEDLFPQFDWAYEYCDMAGIPHLCVDGVEADDTMATVAKWAEKKGAKVFICSSDKDLMQLVNDQIQMILLHKDNAIVNPEKVNEIFGVRPDQMLDYLAIVGDASDNIPGLEGFGPKTATALLQEFGTLDEILKNPDKVKGPKKQQILREKKDIALMSRQLATLDMQIEAPQEESFYALKNPDQKKLSDFFHSMNFTTLLRDLGTVEAPLKKKAVPVIDRHQYHLVDDDRELALLIEKLSAAKEICIDTETTGGHPLLTHLVGIGFGLEPGEAWYIPCNGHLGRAHILKALHPLLSSKKNGFYGHNLKYDYHVLRNYGIEIQTIVFDTILASYILNSQSRRHNLDELTLEKFKKVKIPITDLIGKGKQQTTLSHVPIEDVKEYCAEDVDYTSRLKSLFSDELEERKLGSIFYGIELPLLPILAKMERTGIHIDIEKLKKVGAELSLQIEELKKLIFLDAGEEFNLNSPKQLSYILYQKLGLKATGRKTTEFATGANILEKLAEEHPAVQNILDYRTLEKLRSTYVEALPHSVNPETGRIHCTFNQSVAATGRLSCQDPNLQNIPVRSKEGMRIRECFIAKEGCSFLAADYSQIELRLLAHFSEDPELIKAFKRGDDIHSHTASLVFNLPIEMITPEMRNQAKTVNFGIIYGQSAFGLSKELHISIKEAADFINKYFEQYPNVLDYLDQCVVQVKKTGSSKTLTGRERPIPEITNRNPMIRAAAERLAVNTPLQGTGADLIKMAMIEIDREIVARELEGKMILQIHDELIFEVPDTEIETLQMIVKEKMENVFKLKVPIEVDIAVGKNWGEC